MNKFSGQKWEKKLGHAVIMMNDERAKYKSTKFNASKLKFAFPSLTKLKHCKLALNLLALVKKIKISVSLTC